MKILFLDVDGVLNKISDADVINEGFYLQRLNRKLIDKFLKIVDDTDCRVILSSTWRKRKEDIAFLLKCDIPINGITDSSGPTRGHEIQRWLDKNEVFSYAIVDDDSDMLDSQRKNFFQTDPEYGLTETIAYRITYRLNSGL